MDISEDELIEQAVRGDRDALTALLRGCAPQVRAALTGRIDAAWRPLLEIDDVLQVTYLEAFLRISSFSSRGSCKFAGWLIRIAANNMQDAIRYLARDKRLPPQRRIETQAESSLELLEQLGFTTTTPSRHAAAREVHRVVEAAVDRLPRDYAHVIRKYDLEGLGVAELADEMQRSVGAVFMLRARALDCLRDAFTGQGQLGPLAVSTSR